MSDSGTYILNEYFILKLIFSYLPSRDLHNAAKVCREWNALAQKSFEEHGEPQSCCMMTSNDIVPPLNEKQSPNIILDFSANSPKPSSFSTYRRSLQLLYDTYYLEDTSIYHINAGLHFFSWKHDENPYIGVLKNRRAKGADPSHSLMLLSNMPGVNIECFQEFQKRIVKASDGTVANLEDITKSKGILLIVGSRTSSTNQAQLLLDELINISKSNSNVESEMILAGGITRTIRRIQSSCQRTEVLGITFNGENVTVHGDIHIPHKMVYDEFMRNFSERVGPIPEGSVRMAFAFVCINRLDSQRDVNLFKEHFPGVPIYGFYSFGEYYLQGLKGNNNSKLKKTSSTYPDNENYFYTDSTSFLIVTLKKTKCISS